MTKRYNLFNFYFIAVIWINFCISASFYLTTIISTSYALDILHAKSAVAGFASGIFVIGVMVARLCVGKSLDKLNLKKWLILGLFASLAFNALYFFAHNIALLNLTRFLHGLSFGLCSSVCGTIVARMIPSFKRGVGIGYYGLSSVVASGIAPFVAVYLVNHSAFDAGFCVSLGFIACAILCVFAMKVRELKKGALHFEPRTHSLKTKLLEFIEPSALRIAFVGFLVAFCFGGILSFIGAYCKERGLIEAGSAFFIVYAVTSLLIRPFAGRIFDIKGHNAIIAPSLVFLALALVLIAFAQNGFVLILGAICCAFGYGNFVSSAQSLAIKLAPKDKLGLATATYFMMIDLGAGVGPYFLGFAIGAWDFSVAFLGCGVIAIFALVAYYLLIVKGEKC
ncbi:MFS transporter [Helicobacter sp. 23-1044]